MCSASVPNKLPRRWIVGIFVYMCSLNDLKAQGAERSSEKRRQEEQLTDESTSEERCYSRRGPESKASHGLGFLSSLIRRDNVGPEELIQCSCSG